MHPETDHEARGLWARLNGLRRRAGAGPALVVVALASALALLPAASGAATPTLLPTYTASVAPTAVFAGSTTAFTASINNVSVLGTVGILHSVKITVPTEFSIVSVGSPGLGWTVARSGQDILLTNLLNVGGSVSVPITAGDAGNAGFYTFVTSASTVLGAEARQGPDPAVQVVGPNGVIVHCTPANTAIGTANDCRAPAGTCGDGCPTLDDGTTMVRAETDPAASNDILALDLTGLGTDNACGHVDNIFNVSDPSRSKTVTYDVPGDTQDICWMASSPFTDKFGHQVTTGGLAFCTVQTDGPPRITPPPCIDSVTFTGYENTYAWVIKVPSGGGDPGGGRSIAGIRLP